MRIKIILLIVIFIGIGYGKLFAQYSNSNVKPRSFSNNSSSFTLTPMNLISEIRLQKPNVDSVINYDTNHKELYTRNKCGIVSYVNHNMVNLGTWDTLIDNSRILRLKIIAADACFLQFIFDKFYLPDNSTLHIYTLDRKFINGPFVKGMENPNRKFGTNIIPSDTVIFEYWEPQNSTERPNLNIWRVSYGYKNIAGITRSTQKKNSSNTIQDNDSPCTTDVNCVDDWCHEKKSITRIWTGQQIFTGSLINQMNTTSPQPYILTAEWLEDVEGHVKSLGIKQKV
ncbi:MAG: hypothetical protein NT007_15710 [Candidatus Kapabacteria bacterium]|nr:hypothetical protein [Candidatus Kapabacteria bacterium]